MLSTGIVRKVDELGRIVIPKETRDQLGINVRDSLEIFMDGEKIILKKYAPGCVFCGKMENLFTFKERLVCRQCAQQALSEPSK